MQINPSDTATLSITYSNLKPNGRHVFITFWTPDVQKLPYKAALHAGNWALASHTGHLSIENSLLQIAQSVGYYLSNDFGYVGNNEFQTHVQVTGAWWEDIHGNKITSAWKGQTVKGCVSISTDMCGTFTLSIRKDIAFGLDKQWESSSWFLNMAEPTLFAEFSVDASQSYGGWLGQCRGYFINVVVNGIEIYKMDEYPPRLIIR